MSDCVLTRLGAGNASALRECIDRHGGLVWSLARRLSRTPADVEDATQEIFIEIWRHAARFDESKGSETMFIATIARRRLIDRLRRSSSESVVQSNADIAEAEDGVDVCCEVESSWDAGQAKVAIADLRPEQRRVLELCFFQGMTQTEIACHLSLPLGTVKSSMRRGLLQVRQALSAAPRPALPGERSPVHSFALVEAAALPRLLTLAP